MALSKNRQQEVLETAVSLLLVLCHKWLAMWSAVNTHINYHLHKQAQNISVLSQTR